MIARVNININGTIIDHFESLSVAQPFDDHHRMDIRIGMDDVNDIFGVDGATGSVNLGRLTQDWAGKKITITISQGETDILGVLSAVAEQAFEGLITKIQVQMRDSVDSIVEITAMSPTIILDQGENTYSFSEMSLSALINKILKADGWQTANSPSNNPTIPYVTQYRETVYHFVQRLAKKYGEWFFYDGSKFVFGKSALTASEAIKLEYGSNLTDMAYETRLVPLTIQSAFYNYTSDEAYTYQSTGNEVSAQNFAKKALQSSLDTYKFQHIDLSFQNYPASAPLEADVTNSLRMASNRLAVLKGTCSTLGLAPGKMIRVNDDIQINGRTIRTESYGDFLVTKSYHYLDSNGQYQNTFEAIPNNPDFPPTSYPLVSQPIAECQKAIVVDVNDPEQLGRVRVHIFWQHPSNHTTPWIRVANLMSGDNTGVYFVPEVGETVFVDFESGNPDMPFVRGSMFNGNHQPGSKFSGSGNVHKGIITKSGNHIIIDDTNGKESIHLYNKDKTNEIMLTMEGSGEIAIRSNTKIIMGAPDIIMKAENIVMSASDAIQMDANRVKIAAQLALILDVVGPLLMSSKSLAVLDSMGNTAVGGKSELSLGSLNTLDIKGNQVTVAAESSPKLGEYKLYDWIPVDLPDSILSALMSIPSPILDKANKISTSAPKEASLILKSQSKALFESSMNLNIKADMSVEVDGSDVLMEAKGVSKLKGGAMVEVKGKLVTIN